MAGSISLSLSQQFDTLGKPLDGGFLYFYAAGTTTPQSAYQDSGLTIPWPNPLTLDNGRVPQLFFADGSIKLRLTDADGVVQLAADGILVIGASSGGGGGSPVDATTILQTGQLVHWYGTGSQTGFVRSNGRSIGSSVSGATERANADTLALFTFLYQQDANLVVSTGRGASAAADWAANKNIALPDLRNRALAGLGDMGNSDAALFSGVTFTSGNSTTLGSPLGAGRKTLQTANLPPYTPSGVVTLADSGASNWLSFNHSGALNVGSGTHALGDITSLSASFSGNAQGGTSTAFDLVQPTMLTTIYMKL